MTFIENRVFSSLDEIMNFLEETDVENIVVLKVTEDCYLSHKKTTEIQENPSFAGFVAATPSFCGIALLKPEAALNSPLDEEEVKRASKEIEEAMKKAVERY